MPSLFEPSRRDEIVHRLEKLPPGAPRQWGKMSAGQMLAHCSIALEAGTGDAPRRQALIGKILAPFVKRTILSEKPFSRNSPTDPTFVIRDDRSFEEEKKRLLGTISRFCEAGPQKASEQTHSFLGRLTGEEWGTTMYKHLDHHLRQFGG